MVLYQGKRKYLKSIDRWTKPKRKAKRKNNILIGKLNTVTKTPTFEQVMQSGKARSGKPTKKETKSFFKQLKKVKVQKRR